MSFHDTFKPGDLVLHENRSGTMIPQTWICPPGMRHHLNESKNKLKRQTGVLPEGVYLIVAVRDYSVDVIFKGKIVELLAAIDLYPVNINETG